MIDYDEDLIQRQECKQRIRTRFSDVERHCQAMIDNAKSILKEIDGIVGDSDDSEEVYFQHKRQEFQQCMNMTFDAEMEDPGPISRKKHVRWSTQEEDDNDDE